MVGTGKKDPDVFTLLKNYYVPLSRHVEFVLQNLGFQCLRSIASIETPSELEFSVRTLLGNDEHFSKMSIADKEMIFGELFKNNPENFVFLPGERLSIVGAISMAKKLLENYEKKLSFEPESGEKRKITYIDLEEVVKTEEGTSEVSKNNLPLRRKGKTAKEYFERWKMGTKLLIDSTTLNVEFSQCGKVMKCLNCHLTFTLGYDSAPGGRWKLNTVYNHIQSFHQIKLRTVSTPLSNRTPLVRLTKLNSKEIEKTGSKSRSVRRSPRQKLARSLSLA